MTPTLYSNKLVEIRVPIANRVEKTSKVYVNKYQPTTPLNRPSQAGGGEHVNFIHYQVNQNLVILALTTHPPQRTIEKQDLVPMGT